MEVWRLVHWAPPPRAREPNLEFAVSDELLSCDEWLMDRWKQGLHVSETLQTHLELRRLFGMD